MDKCMCDVCCKNPANHQFKAKRMLPVIRADMHVKRWVRIDICDSCFRKLLHIMDGGEEHEAD